MTETENAPADRTTASIEIPGLKILRILGQGSFSLVYEARQQTLQRNVAVKVLTADVFDRHSASRFQQECLLLSSMQSEHIVSVFGAGTLEDGRPYLILELIRGLSLSALLKEQTTLDQEECVSLMSQVLKGLGSAHRKNVIHRDLKPSNIMLTKDSEGAWLAKLVDFGIARRITDSGSILETLTHTGEALGTPLYMSPEQCSGSEEVSFASDIYSLGCIMYEALCGEPPFTGETNYQVMYKQVHEKAKPLGRLVPKQNPIAGDLEQLVAKAMSKRKQDRFQDTESMRQELLQSNLGDRAVPSSSKSIKALVAVALIVAPLLLFLIPKATKIEPPLLKREKVSTMTPGVASATRICEQRSLSQNPQKRQQILEDSLKKFESRSPKEDVATAHQQLGRALSDQHRFAEALVELDRAARIYQSIGFGQETFKQGGVLRWIAHVNYHLGNVEKAKELHMLHITNLQSMQEKTDPVFSIRQQAEVEASLGRIFRAEGNPEEAIKHWTKAFEQIEEVRAGADNHEACQHLIQIACAQYILERTTEAEQLKKRIISLFHKKLDNEIASIDDLAQLLVFAGDYKEAENWQRKYTEWLAAEDHEGSTERQAFEKSRLAQIELRLGKIAEARALVTEALNQICLSRDPGNWLVFMVAGEVELACGDQTKALEYLKRSESTVKYKLSGLNDYYLYWLLARAYEKNHQNNMAFSYLEKSKKIWRSFAPRNADYRAMVADHTRLARTIGR